MKKYVGYWDNSLNNFLGVYYLCKKDKNGFMLVDFGWIFDIFSISDVNFLFLIVN